MTIQLISCKKGYTTDLDKTISPLQTIDNVDQALKRSNLNIISSVKRIDVGRLGIPVYISMCGKDALDIMPTRKQMGKGSSAEQARASAMMELIERYSFFNFQARIQNIKKLYWNEAEKQFGEDLLPISTILTSVKDNLSEKHAKELLNLVDWTFYPATKLINEKEIMVPIDWFKLLNEFNGTSAGNTNEESILQGISELIERHVCAIINKEKRITPTIDQSSCNDPILKKLIEAFKKENIKLILKDFSCNMPIPTVGAIAYDLNTFPSSSEIVFTAGTASSASKAAIRAITEIAQLAGDFCTNACYEASGLDKFKSLEDCKWLNQGDLVNINDLPSLLNEDIKEEIYSVIKGLDPLEVFAIDLTDKTLSLPAHYSIIPGLEFRERDKYQSLGLFIGRKLAEETDENQAINGLNILNKYYSSSHFMPFFYGLLALRTQKYEEAKDYFSKAKKIQPDNDNLALVTFYNAYTETLNENWGKALPDLKEAAKLAPDFKEYSNLLGVACFKLKNYEEAAKAFEHVLSIDKGSAIDLANLGLCQKFLGEHTKAETTLKNALDIDPSLDFAQQHLHELQKKQFQN